MQDLRASKVSEQRKAGTSDSRRDLLFMGALAPLSIACLVSFFTAGQAMGATLRTVFLLVPLLTGVVWLAYEQLHDLVWWRIHPLCPICKRSYDGDQRPKPGVTCDCCDTPLYPLRTPQDFKVIVLVTTLTVIGLPIFAFWAALVSHFS
jgi:hypothetical protein